MSGFNKILELLLPLSNADKNTIETLSQNDDITDILRTLLPENFLMFDSECIESLNDYVLLILKYAEATGGQWQPTHIEAKGELDSTIQLTFNNDDKATTWIIEQNASDYVSETFLDNVSAYCSKELPGTFIDLPTSDQQIATTYLPKDIARKFRKVADKFITIDSACMAIRNRDKSIIHKDWFNNALHTTEGILDDRDREGDTIFTAALRSGDIEYAKYIKSIANIVKPGHQNQTPYQIALDNNMHEIAEELLYLCTEEAITWNEAMSSISADRNSICIELQKLIEILDNRNMENILYPAYHTWEGQLLLGIKPEFLDGHNTISLKSHQKGIQITLSVSGKNSCYIETICNHEEALELVDQFLSLTMDYSGAENRFSPEKLIQRIREHLSSYENINEKNMFGGITFSYAGKTILGVIDGHFMIRVEKDDYQNMLQLPNTSEMVIKGKPSKGFICVEANGIEQDQDLDKWIKVALQGLLESDQI